MPNTRTPVSHVRLLTGCLALALLAAAPVPAAPRRPRPAAKPKPAGGGPDLPSQRHVSAPFCTVNGETITVGQYIDRISLRFAPEMREVLVNELLLRQEARRRKLAPTAAEMTAVVDRAFRETVERVGGEQKLAKELQVARGWSLADYRTVIRTQAQAQVIREKLAAALVKPESISDADVRQRYEAQRAAFSLPDRVRVSQIVVRRPAEGGEAADRGARERAEALLKRVKGGTDFETVARDGSDDKATAPSGGRLPLELPRGGHPYGAAFDAAVYAAPLGLVGEVVAGPDAYYVLRVDEKKPAAVAPFEEVRDRVRAVLVAERQAQALTELLARLQAQAKLETGKF